MPQQNVQPNLYSQVPSNNATSGHVFINPHAAAQAAATAAFAAAAQQVANAQIQSNGNQSSAKGNSFLPNNAPNQQVSETTNSHLQGITHHGNQTNSLTATGFTPNEPAQGPPAHPSNIISQPFQNPQQLAISAQAQAAAILAAGGINPALLFNQGAIVPASQTPAALAAAQVVASLIQPQTQPPSTTPQIQEQKPAQHTHHTQQSQIQHVNHIATPQVSSPSYNPQNHNIASASNMNNGNAFKVPNQQRNVNSKQPSVMLHGSDLVHQTSQQTTSNKNGLYATAAAAAASNPILLAQMQTWKLDQLEAHVRLLREANQPVTQAVSLLLAEARRREEKRTAKRVANRKSACTSRARKKALVEEMTRTNAKLRRQAMILALLPDLVIAIKIDGRITFCSAQVERVLRHKADDMIGANIKQLLVPSCREALAKLIEKLLAAEQAAIDDNNKQQIDEVGGSDNSGGNTCAAIISENSDQGFPMSVVKVKSRNPALGEEVSDSSGTGNASNQSPTTRQDLNSADKGEMGPPSKGAGCNGGDDSSSSTVAKQLSKANEALDSNVRRHNAKIRENTISHKDDVTGASVTANNADARLSSLQHKAAETLEDNSSSTSTDSLFAGVEDKRLKSRQEIPTNGNTSEDSGYRISGESDPSREDTSSSTSDTSNAGSRPRPLAPTCNVTLIRNDLSTILCEVTSSIRTRSLFDENCDSAMLPGGVTNPGDKFNVTKDKKDNSSARNDNLLGNSETGDLKELLLCLRPIRDGEERVGEDFRFTPRTEERLATNETEGGKSSKVISDDNVTGSKGSSNGKGIEFSASNPTIPKALKFEHNKNRPMKKRPLTSGLGVTNTKETGNQKMRTNPSIDAEKSVVESLMLMSNHRK